MAHSTIVFAEDEITVADIDDFEEVTGISLLDSLENLKAGEQRNTKVLTGLIWLAARRNNPELTYEDARHIPVLNLDVRSAPANRDERRRPTKASPRTTGSKSKGNSRKGVAKNVSKR